MWVSPHFKLFYFNERFEFCEFFEWKIKQINDADLFSQPSLLIFTKGVNISEQHCETTIFDSNFDFLGKEVPIELSKIPLTFGYDFW